MTGNLMLNTPLDITGFRNVHNLSELKWAPDVHVHFGQ